MFRNNTLKYCCNICQLTNEVSFQCSKISTVFALMNVFCVSVQFVTNTTLFSVVLKSLEKLLKRGPFFPNNLNVLCVMISPK